MPHIDKYTGGKNLDRLEVRIMHQGDCCVCEVNYSRAHCVKEEIFETRDIWKMED
ncbi:MAG: hypothetical protein L7U86_00320 [Rhodobacteraceae bacterium]|nr:hypothetical protein [Paracoccaceae bacterium]